MPERAERGDARITFRRRGLVIGESYFSEPADQFRRHLDVLRVVAAATPPAGRRRSNDAHALAIDLARQEDQLFDDISADTRRKIRRALDTDESGTTMHVAPSADVMAEFCDAYDRFAPARNLGPIFRPRLYALAASGNLMLSAAHSREGSVLVWHAYAATRARAHLLYSASVLPEAERADDRNVIGRANRLLHWDDIRSARAQGLEVLDLGGVDVTGRSEETTRIARFKLNFGGVPTPTHSWSEARSLKGSLVLLALRARGSDF